MSILELIEKRHSYRGEYESTPVPREDLVKIMKAGLAAPSGCQKAQEGPQEPSQDQSEILR